MTTTNGAYVCAMPGRVQALRAAALQTPPRLLNGIHFLEVAPGQRRLEVHFVHPLSLVPAQPLGVANVEVRGGERVRDPAVTAVHADGAVLHVELAAAGDFSRYVLRLVAGAGTAAPPPGIDPALAQVEFGFKADCPSALDCRADDACPPDVRSAPAIDYLARDYASLRRLVLDRLSTLMPQWRERNGADLLVTLAEALAYRGDELSYWQDAVATEAYLGTARRRESVRRHARLLDYPFHDGCNARTWVAFEAEAGADGLTLPGCDPDTGLGGTLLLTRTPGLGLAVDEAAAAQALAGGAEPFELLQPLTLYRAHNDLRFFTWSDDACCLPQGATRAFLRDDEADATGAKQRLRLRAGDVLVLEERLSPVTGQAADADRLRRHAVRLTRVEPEAPLPAGDGGARGVPARREDPVTGQAFVEVEWADADALPFALSLSARIGGTLVPDVARAVGNVALADHGATAPRAVDTVPLPGGRVPRRTLALPTAAPLTQQGRVRLGGSDGVALFDPGAGAAAALQVQPADVRPALALHGAGDQRRWSVRRDLLASDAGAAEFVVEVGNAGETTLRFGDDVHGRRPAAGERLQALARSGSGRRGNVGAEAIAHVRAPFAGIAAVRNPLPAQGGLDPEPLARVRLDAPQAFKRQERAVTAEDYRAVAEREPRVQRAVATRRWTGSWHTVFITVDRRGGAPVDAAFEDELRRFIERYRLAGHDVEIDAPRYVGLDIELHVCARPGHFPAAVEQRLLAQFSAQRLPDGRTGFFHPDRFSFGQPVLLSAVVATAMSVPGVAYVTPVRFQRLGRAAAGEIAAGRIALARLEIARLDNDPNAPQHGRLRFDVHPGS